MILQEFFQALVQELNQLFEDLSLSGPAERLRKKLRILYGRGEIDRDTFFRLLGRLGKGYYIEGELDSLARQAAYRRENQGRAALLARSPEVSRGLDFVHLNRARLEEARVGLAAALETVRAGRAWAEQQAGDFREKAQASLPDETAARAYLEIRQQMLAHQDLLDRRIQAMQNDLRRIERLEAQLRLYESELAVVQSRERLAGDEWAIQRRLHS